MIIVLLIAAIISGVLGYIEGEGIVDSFYKSRYIVNIDRSPNNVNLDALMESQGEYFTDYQKYLAQQNGTQISGEINKQYAYRSSVTPGDYYGLVNSLYYKYVGQEEHNLADKAMYAFNVNSSTMFKFIFKL